MSEYDYDLVVIGAGSGGVASSRRAASYGARVAICEASRVGGTCVIRGCVPKKLLVYGAHYREEFEDAAGFGWTTGAPRLNWGALQAARGREVDRLNGAYLAMLRDAGVTLLEGRGVLADPHTVRVGERVVRARYVLVATGGHPLRPAIPGVALGITSNEALELPALPATLLIVGGGYIGVEFAGIFNALGVAVTLSLRCDAILRGFDEDVRAALTDAMRARGVAVRPDTEVTALERDGAGVRVHWADGAREGFDAVLFATGRGPNTEGLGLDEAGVARALSGAVLVDGASRSSVPSVYAVGDCTNRRNLTPVAIAEGRAVAESLFNNRPMEVDHEGVPSAVFSQPPVGTVGLSERAARERYGAVDAYVSTFRPLKNAVTGRAERTLVKLVVDRASDRVVGCHMVGPDAPEIIQGLAVALRCGATKAQFDATVGVHPSAAEEFVTLRTPRAP